ncbi:L-histidine N(alpha)-methyltransferase [Burkholderiaceae bacterium UC74_6]
MNEFLADVLTGLGKRQKSIPPRWFYDRAGSEIFEEITRLPEYYPTEAEREILSTQMSDIADVVGTGKMVVEFGSGSSTKTPAVLIGTRATTYVPIDISGEFLRESASALAKDFPALTVHPIEGDFTRYIELPQTTNGEGRIGFFPGSTIGNLDEADAVALLRQMHGSLGEGAILLIGMDRCKPESRLIPAYDDRQGVTARFNLNLLRRINAELEGSIDVAAFQHRIRWNAERSRIEMHLRARHDLAFEVMGERFSMQEGETIHTENSYKYRPGAAHNLLRAGGWEPLKEWTDREGLFSVFAAARVDAAGVNGE